VLKQHQLIQPWSIELKQDTLGGQSKNRKIEGLFRIDELAFNKLDAQALYRVQQAALPKTETGEIDMSFLADDTMISFESL